MDSEMGLSGKTVLVVGTGISGIAAVNLLATQSANIILLDGNTELSPETVAAKFSEDIHYDLILGDLPDQVMDRIDLAVLSPGVPTDLPFVVRMQEAGIPIWGEIELAYVCGKGKVVAITGTNGKTTTTALTGEIMKAYYDSVFVVGNIGLPYTQYAMQMCDDPQILPSGQRYFEHNAGPSQQTSYDGVLYRDESTCCDESDQRADVRTQL